MGLLKLAALGTLGYVGYKYYEKNKDGGAAYAEGQGSNSNFSNVRDSGPNAMRDKPARSWNEADEDSDQSFPASDPPANY
ncbi:hypothetical protein [Altericroceibacterium endophyticum]|nr:hypothetical protein [Altericroceibacterium endophyticum]